MSKNRRMYKENVLHVYNGVYVYIPLKQNRIAK